jgi:tetratricopeptide (TPR) repeat protein
MAKTRAREYVWLGQVEDALAAFRQAVELDPTLELVPEEEVARLLVGVAEEHRYAGDYDEALAALRRAVELDPEIETREEVDLARTYNQVCWRGSLDGWAEKVLPICERVVELMPDDAGYVDSRGLARALTGDYAGAIDDFWFYVEWSRQTGLKPDRSSKREAWISELEAGRNPFDEATLEDLRHE